MTQEEKDLLLKDLCARLPYGIKISKVIGDLVSEPRLIRSINLNNIIVEDGEFEDGTPDIDVWNYEDIKPYLFPIESMTEEQKVIYGDLCYKVLYNSKGLINLDVMEYVNWCYKNHIDINNLIPMGLANDATNKNIY